MKDSRTRRVTEHNQIGWPGWENLPLHEVDHLRTFVVEPDRTTLREEFAWFPKRSTFGSIIWMKSYIIYETWITIRGVEKRLLDTALYTQCEFVEAKLKGEVN